VVKQYTISLTIYPVTKLFTSYKITNILQRCPRQFVKDAVFALELMNVVSQQEQQMGVSSVLMIPSSKKENLKMETTSPVESITKNMPTNTVDN